MHQTPLFPFGFGLTYTSFAYEKLAVTGGVRPRVTFTVRNVGDKPGAAVPQVYLTALPDRSAQRLLGWRKVELAAGESRTVTIEPDKRLLSRFDAKTGVWKLDAGRYQLALGSSAQDLVASTNVALRAETLKP
jgi:beta-glucosidase